ncbi:sensor histidine kinase, partial [Burkholderia multivorans]
MDTSLNAPHGAHAPFPSRLPAPGSAAATSADPVSHPVSQSDPCAQRIAVLSAQLLAADEAARRHLAGELHDGLGAELTAARFALANAQAWLPA